MREQDTKRSEQWTPLRRMVANCWPPIVALVVGVLLWSAAIRFFEIPKVLLPAPGQVAAAAWKHRSELFQATMITALSAICGFLLSVAIGTLIAVLFSQSKWLRNGLFPYAIFLQTVPIVAIAPLIVIWMGEGFAAVVIIAFIIGLFPMITNGTAGMLARDNAQYELFRMNNASRWQTITLLQLPGAMPDLVTGARISSGLCVLGAIVGEYFAGAGSQQAGLGYLIFAAKDQFELDRLFAAVLLCTLLGVVIFSTVGWIGERGLLHWRERQRSW